MKAFLLAAGRGERLRPLTDTTPKPLLQVGQHRLIEYHLYNLAAAGIKQVVINTSWLGDQIQQELGDGHRYGVTIEYSDEGENILETAGGIVKALPLLGNRFIVINADIWTDFDLKKLIDKQMGAQAHLILVNNPDHNPGGDFALKENIVCNKSDTMYTYAGLGLYSAALFDGMSAVRAPLAALLRNKIEQQLVTGEIHHGLWSDIGTIERLEKLEAELKNNLAET